MPTNWQSVERPPALLVLPPGVASLDEADAAVELWEHYAGKTLHPTQRLSVQLMMAETADGRWAAKTTGREVSRQNGKGVEVEVVELWGLVQRAEAILHTIHDAVLLATQTQQRMLAVLEGSADLRRRIRRKWQGTGQQMIELRNGGTIWYRTRTSASGRGLDDVDRVVIDEAQHATVEQIEAVTSTMGANSNPQMNVAGTAAIEGRSEWWWGLRRRAIGPDPGAFAYLGHTAEVVHLDDDGRIVQEPVAVADRDLWRWANPSIAAGLGGGMEFLEEEFRRLPEASFAREHLGVWDPPPVTVSSDPKIPAQAWAATLSAPPPIQPGEVTLAFDVSLDGEWASIAIATGSISAPYVEVIEHERQTGWLPKRVVDLVQRWNPTAIGCNGAGPTGAQVGPVLAAMSEAGLSADRLTQLGATAYKAACGGFYADVVEGRLSRPDGQGPLDEAVGDASERPLGDAWAWNLRNATVPISPLVAATIARALLPVAADPTPGIAGDYDAEVYDRALAELEEEEARALEALNAV